MKYIGLLLKPIMLEQFSLAVSPFNPNPIIPHTTYSLDIYSLDIGSFNSSYIPVHVFLLSDFGLISILSSNPYMHQILFQEQSIITCQPNILMLAV